MGRVYEINVMDTLTYKVIAYFSESFSRYLFTLTAVTDFVILTEYTAEITARKENRSASFCTAYGRLLP